ncbi:hypothetical protein D7V80_26645 [Corallococcus sp. CA054B]|nr:hypothetical protein D7V80_26645 [Corallococcus sp. CA054B]
MYPIFMTRLNRFVPSLLALACMACAAGRTAAPVRPQWPLPQELVRWEPVPGASVVAPRVPPGAPRVDPTGVYSGCKDINPADVARIEPQATAYVTCSWYQLDLGRQLNIDLATNVYGLHASSEEKREQLRVTLIQRYGISEKELTRLPAPWYGWEWRKSVQEWLVPPKEKPDGPGELLRDRWIVAGTSLVFLQVVSAEADPFPEGEAFLDSLRVTDLK